MNKKTNYLKIICFFIFIWMIFLSFKDEIFFLIIIELQL
ncbi:MAG: hypothetical protein WJU30_00503 [Candidatus Phytoplasma pruni]